jgi:hypothetical protein
MRKSNRQSGFARRRIPYRVCSCLPNGVVTHLEARLLKEMVNSAIHPIRCAASCKQKYMKGMRIGDLCAETGHFQWALKVWRFTVNQIESKDYDDWIYVYFNPEWYDLQDVVSETECDLLMKRCGNLYQAIGFPEEYWWTREDEHYAQRYFGLHSHYWLFEDKSYGYHLFYDQQPDEWENEFREIRDRYKTEELFNEGQCDYQPVCSQEFTAYWNEELRNAKDDLACFELER